MTVPHPPLADCIGQTFILAYKEDTTQLETALKAGGCPSQVLRQVHQPGYEQYSRSYLCLLNHCQAWQQAAECDRPTLIVEADFVPVADFGRLPSSFDPADSQLGIAWLYTCAPQVYKVSPQGYAEGYSTSMVAYVITATSARLLLELADEIAQDPGPRAYSAWDSGIAYRLADRGFHNYVPFRNYGEHGGLPNPEHQQNRLSRAHRADVLYGPLAFVPAYGQQERVIQARAYARMKGLGRLLLGKYLRLPVLRGAEAPLRLLGFAVGRQWVGRL